MFIETPWLEHPNLQGICFHTKSGDFLIRKNVEKRIYDEYKSIQFLENTIFKYENILHRYDQYYHLKNNRKVMIYYIPKDIYNYIKYKNKNIVANGIVPKEREEKFNICSRWLNVEFNYLFDAKHYNCIGGKKIGLKPSYNRENPIIIIKKSSHDRISFKGNYSQIFKSDYIQNYDKNLAEKIELIKSGDYKE